MGEMAQWLEEFLIRCGPILKTVAGRADLSVGGSNFGPWGSVLRPVVLNIFFFFPSPVFNTYYPSNLYLL